MTPEDKQTDAFFRQCVADGRMTQAEYDELRTDHYSAGTRPEWKPLPDRYRCWCVVNEINAEDMEIFINSEAWTQGEIAEHLGIDRNAVRRAIKRVYRTIPELERFRGNGHAIPPLRDMLSIEVTDKCGNSPADHNEIHERY